ncbi:Ig domain-containing protein [Viscerimonas tarda]
MKKIRLFLMAVFAVVSMGLQAQPTVLFEANFNVDEGFGTEGAENAEVDIDYYPGNSADANAEKVIAKGLTLGAGPNGQRIHIKNTSAAYDYTGTEAAYTAETPDDNGATNGGISFIRKTTAGGGGYLITPDIQGPATITLWTCSGNNSTAQEYEALISANGGEYVSQGLTTLPSTRVIKKQVFTYTGTGTFKFKFLNTTVAGNNTNLYIFRILITAGLDVPAPTTPTLSLQSGIASQNVYAGSAIAPIVYKYGGTATSASVTWTAGSVPAGLSVTPDAEAKTVTIAGTPTAQGNYAYSVTATDGTNTTDALTGTISVTVPTKTLIAYVTNNATPTDAGDVAILEKLRESYDVNVILSTATGVDFSTYKAIVLAALPGSGDAGMSQYKGIAKPLVNLKPFMYQSSRWAWGSPVNIESASDPASLDDVPKGVAVVDAAHPIFAGFGSEIALATGSKHAKFRILTPIYEWVAGNEDKATVLATVPAGAYNYTASSPAPSGTTDVSGKPVIFEFPVGTTLADGTSFTQKNINIGVSEQTAGFLTADYLTIVKNAVDYVILGSGDGIGSVAADNSGKTVVDKAYYDLTGRPVAKSAAKGLLIQKSIYEDGTSSFGKVYIK